MVACDPDDDDGCLASSYGDDGGGGDDDGGGGDDDGDPCANSTATSCTTATGQSAQTPPSPNPSPTQALAPTPGMLSTIGGIITQIGTQIGTIAAGIILFPISNDGCDTLDCPGAPGYQGGRKKNNWSDPQWVEMNCTAIGPAVKVPSTSIPGGFSIEQEYMCPDGQNYTIHTLTMPSGKPADRHVRPNGPKHGKKP